MLHVSLALQGGATASDRVGCAALVGVQLAVAGGVLAAPRRRERYVAALGANGAALVLWAAGLAGAPVGDHHRTGGSSVAVESAALGLQLVALAVSARILLAGPRRMRASRVALPVVAALGVVVGALAAPARAPGSSAKRDHIAEMASIDRRRCDRTLSIPAYWSEAAAVGVDTYEGGTMATDHQMGSAKRPSTSAPASSPAVQALIDRTSSSLAVEGAPVELVAELAAASDHDYQGWLAWLGRSQVLAHGHMAAQTQNGSFGHSGHIGPQPWTALTDPAQCRSLARQLDRARAVALRYPTAADAMAAGYANATPYVPAIAAHFIRYDLIDGKIDIDHPEMILYDGNDPGAHVVGLSYYLWHPGDLEPDAGFTGENDHGHRHHIGMCMGPDGVIGGLGLGADDCRARGGEKDDGSRGWMSHAWVVPGCESPWGVFSAANPVLDGALGAGSGRDQGHCAASAVRARYHLDSAPHQGYLARMEAGH